ncbi:MAG TPA: aminoglycoside phosphotransferase family protein [Micromonosporaceae bacterium]
MHAGQLDIPVDVARRLIDDQFPQWRDLPVRNAGHLGTVNAIIRIGDGLAARFPLVPDDVEDVRRFLRAEADASAELVGRTRFPTPEPVAIGEPGDGYPLPWSVQTWLPGDVATEADAGSFGLAHDLAEFIAGVRAIDTRGRTFRGAGRGGDLHSHEEWVEMCFQRSDGLLDVPRLRSMWAEMLELPPAPGADVMNHGDLIPGNVLVADGRLAGVLDAGGLGPADPALDLVAAWHLLDDGPRRAMRADLDCDEIQWQRGRAWAFQQAMGLVWYYVESNPPMSRLGVRTLGRLMA